MADRGRTTTAMKVLGYVRVSTEEQAELGVSLEAQQAKLTAYAGLYDLGCEFIGTENWERS
jgi:DNA invertase Pin-like site-specific DNA recombinase